MNRKSIKIKNTPVSIGGYVLADTPIAFNTDKPATKIKVKNTGDRPIQVGSHFHFFEVNKLLEFDRSLAFGKRLNIASTTAIRFEPGDETPVELVPYGGKQTIYGFNNLVDGWVGGVGSSQGTGKAPDDILENAVKRGFKSVTK
ncbi:urease subunit beta [Serratia fonticola]|uniref:urease subunit beta n=1 Tax=Serratia fonticola TaxID=47917 RepID=UPI000E0F94B0|nr:urease subunit beta [Serratia fonticola]RDL15148.1 urease subunit beta [Serratia fonticola]